MSAIYPTPAHPDLADGREGERATAPGKWPEDTSNPPVHGQHTGTRGMVHPSLFRVAQHQPN